MSDAELDELERLEALVRGPGWVPDIDKGADYEEWTGKWYTPPRPDGTGGHSLALYADDEELLYANYIAALRNAAPRLIRAARHLANLDKEAVVAENESLRRRLREVERERDEWEEQNKGAKETVMAAIDMASEYHHKRAELRKVLGAHWSESLEDAAARLATAPARIICEAAKKYALLWKQREDGIASAPEGPRGDWDEPTRARISAMTRVWRSAHEELLKACGAKSTDAAADPQAPGYTPPA